jgi:hypothetical protein
MNGLTLEELKKMGIEISDLSNYGNATGDILGYYHGYYKGYYWFHY